jgi:hypothetical protein
MHERPILQYACVVSHLLVPAATGRSKCRGCTQPIKRGELRFGECLPNLFGEGEMTLWFHPLCAAYKRPQAVLETLAVTTDAVPDREVLERAARRGVEHRRLPRNDGAERAASGQATCRSCRQPIPRGSWRIRIVFFEQGRFFPGGFVHIGCRKEYFGTDEMLDQVLHFSSALNEGEREDLVRAFNAEPIGSAEPTEPAEPAEPAGPAGAAEPTP